MYSKAEQIERWLDNNYAEESKLSTLEKELLIKTHYNPEDNLISHADTDSASLETSVDLFYTVRDAGPPKSSKSLVPLPFKDSSMPNVLSAAKDTQSSYTKKEIEALGRRKKATGQYLVDMGIDHEIIEGFTDLELEDKENGMLKANSVTCGLVPSLDINAIELHNAVITDTQLADAIASNHLISAGFLGEVSEESDTSYRIETMPQFKNKSEMQPTNVRNIPRLNDKDFVIDENLIHSVEGAIKFFENIDDIDDITYLPRHFQHHRLKRSVFLNKNEPYHYYKSRYCPSSSDSNIASMKYHRYSRSLKSATDLKTTELLCRMCRGKNWIQKQNFKDHISFCHGVLPIKGRKKPILINQPKSLFIIRRNYFSDYHVSCPSCLEWIKLGENPVDELNSQKYRGLYYKYFLHYIKQHNDC